MSEELHKHLSEIGRRGGKRRTHAKMQSALNNIRKANEKRGINPKGKQSASHVVYDLEQPAHEEP